MRDIKEGPYYRYRCDGHPGLLYAAQRRPILAYSESPSLQLEIFFFVKKLTCSWALLISRLKYFRVVHFLIEVTTSGAKPEVEGSFSLSESKKFCSRKRRAKLKGYSGFKNPFSRLSSFGFKIIFDHMNVSIPNIGSLAQS